MIDKPAPLLVVPAAGRERATAVSQLGRQLGERVYPVHRLDRDTTGVLILARTLDAKTAMEELFRQRALQRRYLALLLRAPHPRAGRVESQLAEDRNGVMRSVARGGQRAVTHYRTIERRAAGTLVECKLETGRRNQIRVHMAELGCPVVGDRKYGDRTASGGAGAPARRLCLHAATVEFVHPVTAQSLRVEAPAPPEFGAPREHPS